MELKKKPSTFSATSSPLYQGWSVSLQSFEMPWAFSLSSVILYWYHQVLVIVRLQHRPSLQASTPCLQGDRLWMASHAAYHTASGTVEQDLPCCCPASRQAVVKEEDGHRLKHCFGKGSKQMFCRQPPPSLPYLSPNPAQQLRLNNRPYGRWSHPGTRVSHWNMTSWHQWIDSCSFDDLCTKH